MSREKERSRLVEMMHKAGDAAQNVPVLDFAATLADYLLDNGVIVPPVKVGDKVYELVFRDGKPDGYYERIVTGYHHTQENPYGSLRDNEYICVVGRYCNYTRHINTSGIGKIVFFTEEEAEKALEERT